MQVRAVYKSSPLHFDEAQLNAGVDEAGRGPLAGPVMAAAVILDPSKPIEGIADSKKLTPSTRERLFERITQNALAYSVSQASVQEIDALNILQATMLAMRRAVTGLSLRPAHVWVDGNHLPVVDIACSALIKGDCLLACISAASILAKVSRDRWCEQIDIEFPAYGFAQHKGYGTSAHLNALKRLGPTPWHRKSFAPVARLF